MKRPSVRAIASAAIAIAVLLGVACSGDSDVTTPEPATAVDSVTNEIPQNVSLSAVMADGGLVVTNDGNVTMSDVKVADGDGKERCDFGTMAPGDDETCSKVDDSWVVTGAGPQDQPVEISS